MTVRTLTDNDFVLRIEHNPMHRRHRIYCALKGLSQICITETCDDSYWEGSREAILEAIKKRVRDRLQLFLERAREYCLEFKHD